VIRRLVKRDLAAENNRQNPPTRREIRRDRAAIAAGASDRCAKGAREIEDRNRENADNSQSIDFD
jgi:hypothetical protein